MLTVIRDRIQEYIAAGKELAEIKSLKPTEEFDPKWGNGFLSPDRFTELVYKDLTRKSD